MFIFIFCYGLCALKNRQCHIWSFWGIAFNFEIPHGCIFQQQKKQPL